MNEEQQPAEQPSEAPLAEAQPNGAQSVEAQSQFSRRRLRELLAIPERDRTDALWDELIALEIDLAPGNRAQSPQADVGRRQDPGQRQQAGRRQDQARRQQQPALGAKPARRFIKKPRRGRGSPSGA